MRANLAWLKRLNHAVLKRHTANPFVRFNTHVPILNHPRAELKSNLLILNTTPLGHGHC
jgi:hypothetical protein